MFRHPAFDEPMAFFGRYTDVVPNERIAWTNGESSGQDGVTTVTSAERGS